MQPLPMRSPLPAPLPTPTQQSLPLSQAPTLIPALPQAQALTLPLTPFLTAAATLTVCQSQVSERAAGATPGTVVSTDSSC